MCVYSLDASHVQKAERGQKLTTFAFPHAVGFAPAGTSADAPRPKAVCMLPGATIAFDSPPKFKTGRGRFMRRAIPDQVATLVEVGNAGNHKDALKFPNVEYPVLLNDLAPGQSATVLMLSAKETPKPAGTETGGTLGDESGPLIQTPRELEAAR